LGRVYEAGSAEVIKKREEKSKDRELKEEKKIEIGPESETETKIHFT
jgi:hypothetical protein